MALKIIEGNLLDLAEQGEFDVIVHGCNCFCTMGSGIAAQIRERYPQAYEADLQTVKGDARKLGTYTSAEANGFTIVNAYTQYSYNKGDEIIDRFEYGGFGAILEKLSQLEGHKRFGFPAIGMGLAGGDKDKIMIFLSAFADAVQADGGDATLVLYKEKA